MKAPLGGVHVPYTTLKDSCSIFESLLPPLFLQIQSLRCQKSAISNARIYLMLDNILHYRAIVSDDCVKQNILI